MPTENPSSDDPPRAVKRRHVLYFSGFDPQGPRHYHRLYTREAKLQADLTGYQLEVGPRRASGKHASTWRLRWLDASGTEVLTDYEFLRWDDIVRAHWPNSRWKLWRVAAYASAVYWWNGLMWQSLKMSWPSFVIMTAPSFLMLSLSSLGGLLVWGVLKLLAAGKMLLGLMTAGLGFVGLREAAIRLEDKTQMAWLMRSIRLIVRQSRGETPELEARLDAFTEHALELSARTDIDELLIVGHSSGCVLATIIVARALLKDPEFGARPSHPALLTLGECVPLLSHLPEAHQYRRELSRLRHRDSLPWIDFTAPSDSCCVALVDPTTVHLSAQALSAELGRGGESPKRLSPRFAEQFTPERYRTLRRDKYRCHFQYLMAFEKTGSYDYFSITAGPASLQGRFAALPSIEDFRLLQRFGGPNT